MRYPRGERGSSANKFVMDGCTPIKVMYNYYECVCVCVCVFVGHCLATKVFIGKLLAIRWVEVTMWYTRSERGSSANE